MNLPLTVSVTFDLTAFGCLAGTLEHRACEVRRILVRPVAPLDPETRESLEQYVEQLDSCRRSVLATRAALLAGGQP